MNPDIIPQVGTNGDPEFESFTAYQLSLESAYQDYFSDQNRFERATSMRVELLSRDRGELHERPDAVVLVPVAIHNEPSNGIRRTIECIANQTNSENLEVILFANYPESADPELVTNSIASLEDTLDNLDSPLSVRQIVVEYPEDEAHIGIIRSDMMDLTMLDLNKRGLDFSLPLVWIDADLTHMSKSSMSLLAKAVEEEPNVLTHHLLDGLTLKDLRASDLSTSPEHMRIASLYEIIYRRRRKQLAKDPSSRTSFFDYNQEHGLAFMYGAYLASGGIERVPKMGESQRLSSAFNRRTSLSVFFNTKAVFDREIGQYIVSNTRYVPGTKAYSSGRRLVQQVSQLLSDVKNDTLEDGSARIGTSYYQNFSHTEDIRNNADSIQCPNVGPAALLECAELIIKEFTGLETEPESYHDVMTKIGIEPTIDTE